MKHRFSILIACLAACVAGQAQVTVEVIMDQDQFLLNESLALKVQINNQSGQELDLGRDNRWLSFAVVNQNGDLVTRLDEVPVTGRFQLKSSQMAKRLVDLMPYYNFVPGRYRVTANLRIVEWNKEFVSKANSFEIVRGAKVWEKVVGVPTESGPPDVRRYVIQQARYLKSMYLYLRVTGLSDSKVYRVFPLGKLVTFQSPQYHIDRASNLHVLFQDGPRSFNYSVINPNAEVILRQRHNYHQSRPTLKGDKDGNIFIQGGIRQLMPTDLPLPRVEKEISDVLKKKIEPEK